MWDSLGMSWYDYDRVNIKNEQYSNIEETDANRRAIISISNYWNALGVFRDDFDKNECDILAKNAYYAICEKAIMDYFGTLEWSIKDGDQKPVESAEDFLHYPNPQECFSDITKPIIRDLTRYDAGVWVKSFDKGGYLTEIKPYLGTEFWKMIDRPQTKVPTYGGVVYNSYLSHGYTKMFWQRSRTGIYIPFQPEEITYFMMYPRSDNVYGKAFIQDLKYQIQYVIDSTRAAGKTFENGIVPSIVYNHGGVTDRQTLYERIQQINLANKGSAKFGGVLHTIQDESVDTLSHKLVDMQWLEGQRFVAQLVWAMWGFPASEFIEGDSNRATAYVQRNVTKSKMLYPIINHFEDKINREILPYLKGYQKDWKFAFVRNIDLDDQLKISQINSTRANTFSQYINTGMKPSLALRLAGCGDDLSTEEQEQLDDIVESLDFQTSAFNTDESGLPEDVPSGRYQDNYSSISFGEGTKGETRSPNTENSDEKSDSGNVKKAKKYISDPKDAPKGAKLVRGARGGYSYEVNAAPQKQIGSSKPKEGKHFILKGDDIEIIVTESGGELKGKTIDTEKSNKLAKLIGEAKTFEEAKKIAQEIAVKNGCILT